MTSSGIVRGQLLSLRGEVVLSPYIHLDPCDNFDKFLFRPFSFGAILQPLLLIFIDRADGHVKKSGVNPKLKALASSTSVACSSEAMSPALQTLDAFLGLS